MALKKKGKGRSSSISVNFGGVESGGKAVADGNYTLEVVEVTEEESSEGNPYLKFKYAITSDVGKGGRIYDNCSLQPQALWRFKTLLECFEIEVPDSSMDIDLSDLVGKTVDVEIANEKWEGKNRPRITGFLGAGGSAVTEGDGDDTEESEEEEEEEKPAPAKKKVVNGKPGKLKVGSEVTFKDDKKKTQEGVITAISGDDATVEVDGEEWELDLSDLTAA